MEKRILGKTGEQLSIIGFGGVVVMDETARDAARYVSRAIERGINYFDVAPYYGNAEQMLGPALKPYRKEVFLACKTEQRTAAQAREVRFVSTLSNPGFVERVVVRVAPVDSR